MNNEKKSIPHDFINLHLLMADIYLEQLNRYYASAQSHKSAIDIYEEKLIPVNNENLTSYYDYAQFLKARNR